jgi:hypothetical protein
MLLNNRGVINMVNNFKKSISWRFVSALLLSAAMIALLLFTLPTSLVNPSVVGAYSSGDSATGLGTAILDKGTWFMYNTYTGGTATYDIQAGNPKNGTNIVGSYTVTANPNGTYTVNYNFNSGITVVDSQLAISASPSFTAKPGQDANSNFGVPITAPPRGTRSTSSHTLQ